jgi:antitoxin component YwqK of YwqJK toxin-antitoxin module
MKKIFFLMVLLASFVALNAQVKPVYFYGDKVITDKNKATTYAIYGKLSDQDIWMFKRYDLYDNLLQTGSYSNELLTVPHGKFTFYYSIADFNIINRTNYKLVGKTRFVSQEGNFVYGKEEGHWLTFYPDGNVLINQNFINGTLEGEYKEFDKYGIVTVAGNYLNGLKHGEWILEKGTRIDTFENGILKSTRYVKNKTKASGRVKN